MNYRLMAAQLSEEPHISLCQMFVYAEAKKSLWNVGWRIENLDRDVLRLDTVRFPHGQFKADEQRFEPAIILEYGESSEFPVAIECKESPGAIVENAFAIFTGSWREEDWRIFVRLRIDIDNQRRPIATAELSTMQRAGFSNEDQSEN